MLNLKKHGPATTGYTYQVTRHTEYRKYNIPVVAP